jgi:hypothetical protein
MVCGCGDNPPPMMTSDAGPDTAPPDDAGPPPPTPLSEFFNVDVAMFQSVKIILTKGGISWSENAEVAEGKPGILRVYLSPAGSMLYQGAVQCDLELDYPNMTKKTFTDKHVLSSVSKDADLKSTFDFPLMAADLVPDMTFKVSIYDPKVPTNVLSYPNDGTTDSLRVKGYVSDFRVQLLPVEYKADNMDLLPDVSGTQADLYKQTILQMYPLANVTFMQNHAPMVWTMPISPGGTGWDELLMAVAQQRVNDNPPADVYYIGSFRSTTTYGAYCGGGCILGLSPVPQADDPTGRVSLIIGYTGQESANTLNHELGHALGRLHAPCGAPGQVDPKFPYSTGHAGVWGYDYVSNQLIDPNSVYDFMSYCGPIWVSDYTYKGLYTRISYVRQAAGFMKDVANPRKWHVLSVMNDGSSRWLQSIDFRTFPGERKEATVLDSIGHTIGSVTAGSWDLPDVDRHALFVPDLPAGAARLRVSGREIKLP